jgi:peptidyl-prolyl cis-trans isomerase C
MTRPMPATLLVAALFALATAAHAAPPAKSVTTVNGKPIPQIRLDSLTAAQVAQGQTDTPELRNAVREELVRREVLAQEAEKKGFDKKPDVVSQIAMTRQNVLIGAYLQDYVKGHPVTDDMVKAEYDKLRKTLGEKEYKARHILLKTEEEAKAVIAKIKAGEKFEELAKQSEDPGSKERGGDLGWSNKASYVKPFSDALTALEKGKVTEAPVKSDFGWHVIQLEDMREMKAPTLDEIKPQLTQRMQQQMVEKHIIDLRAKAKVQ